MKRVLILGAGLVTKPAVEYLLKHGFYVTVASRTVSKAEKLVAGYENSQAIPLLVDNEEKLETLIKDHDLSVSLLPYTYHVKVAKLCIKNKKHLVTTSYVSDAMLALDAESKAAGVMLLNEIGLDPGIDHMSAMRIIHDVQKKGGKVTHFKSWCGGLPAPEANDVPWGYKFSWSPRGVVMAGKNSAAYRMDDEVVKVPGPELFTHNWPVDVEDETVGMLEGYPNRNSLGYTELYGLEGIKTMFRGTLRFPGWSIGIKKLVDLGYLDEEEVDTKAMTHAQMTEKLLGDASGGSLKERLAKKLNLPVDHDALVRWEWLGLLGDDPIPHDRRSPLDVLADRMLEKLTYAPGERDMIVLFHEFFAEFPDRKERITSKLIDFGIPNGDSAMSRTVSLPAACAIRMVLNGDISITGVHIPVSPEIYNPVLDELETLDIVCVEKATTL